MYVITLHYLDNKKCKEISSRDLQGSDLIDELSYATISNPPEAKWIVNNPEGLRMKKALDDIIFNERK